MSILKSTATFFWYGSTGLASYCFNRKKFPETLNNILVKLGPVYIKMGQVVSTRRDALPEEYIKTLSILRDNVPPESEAVMCKVLGEAFPRGLDAVFSHISDAPIAAGSIAQVYKGTLVNGETVAIKVLRPNVLRKIEENFAFIRAVVNGLEAVFKKIRMINLPGIVAELEELLITQADLNNETKNFIRFTELFADEPNLTVPKVYAEYSTSQVMVTEFVDAILPYDYAKLDIPPEALAGRVDNLMDNMIFLKGMCHADLHPGNFFWNRKGQLVLIDFGLVHHFPDEDRNQVTTFYFSLVEGFYRFATEFFVKNFVIPHPKREKKDINEKELVDELYQIVMTQFHGQEGFSAVFYDLMRVLSRYQLQLKSNTSKMFLTLVTIEGYVLYLDPKFDMLENARKKKMEMAEYASMPEEVEKIVLQDFGSYSTALFKDDCSIQQAYQNRNEHAIKSIGLAEGHFVIDIGCGRGVMLQEIQKKGGRSLGITVSKTEQQICAQKGLECVWSSWEDFDKVANKSYPLADSIIIVEVLLHMATLFENRVGLMDLRLQKLFSWCHGKLKKGGKLYIQDLGADSCFIEQRKYHETYKSIAERAPIVGFPSVKQVIANSDPYFEVVEINNHSHDLLPTYYHYQKRFKDNEEHLRNVVEPRFLDLLQMELDILTEMAEKNIMKLHRIVLQRKD